MTLLKPYMYVVLRCGLQRFLQFIMLWSKDETMLWLLQYSFLYAERHSLSPGIFKEVSAIINKLKKLRVKYKTEKGKLKKSGTSRPKKGWKFFEKMDAIYKENPSIQPPYVIDNSKKSGESDLSVEETTSFEGSGGKFALPC